MSTNAAVSVAREYSTYAQDTEALFNSGSRKTGTEVIRHYAIKRAIALMHAQFQEPLTLQTIADAAHLSPFHFNRIFRSMTGVPPSVYLAALRIERAKHLLLTTNDSVTSICFDVGYNSLGTFTTRFSQFVGTTPTQLRLVSQNSDICNYFQNWSQVQRDLSNIPQQKGPISIEGTVTTPLPIHGLIFIGAFTDPVPQGRPVSCAVLTQPGTYRLTSIPDGQYYLFAAGMQRQEDWSKMLTAGAILRYSGQHAIQIQRGRAHRMHNLALTPISRIDPPILIALPWLLVLHLSECGQSALNY